MSTPFGLIDLGAGGQGEFHLFDVVPGILPAPPVADRGGRGRRQ
jgi:hypothetical protein